jgi:hypothetical protein
MAAGIYDRVNKLYVGPLTPALAASLGEHFGPHVQVIEREQFSVDYPAWMRTSARRVFAATLADGLRPAPPPSAG